MSAPIVDQIITDIEVLRQVSKPTTWTKCDKIKIWDRMEVTMAYCKVRGVGISAIQLGVPVQAAIIKTEKLHKKYINPKVLATKDPTIFPGEGCLSFPGQYLPTQRYNKVLVELVEPDGKIFKEWLEGLEAIVFQHEIDHMAGRLFWESKFTPRPIKRAAPKINRNAKCPCGSGKKFKQCCIGKEEYRYE